MPARPHRTVDRVTGILGTVSLSPRGVTLAELANAFDAAKSSVQELTNGLLARGYLVEEDVGVGWDCERHRGGDHYRVDGGLVH
jgi:hypothetical protein